MEQKRGEEEGIDLHSVDVDEGYELSRVTSRDALNTLPTPTSSPTLSPSHSYDLYPSPSSESLSPSASFDPLYGSSSPALGSSLDNLTVKKVEEDEVSERTNRSDRSWAGFDYLGKQGEIDCLKRSFRDLCKMHLYAFLCLLVCGTYIAIYVPLVITQELQFRLKNEEYRNVPMHTRVALAVGYGLHNAYIGIYGLILMTLVVGFKQLRFMIPFNIVMFCGIAAWIVCYYYIEHWYRTIHPFYSIIVYILIGIQILTTAGAFGYRVKHMKAVVGFTAGVTISVLVFVGIIDYVGVPIFLGAGALGKSIFRISVIPSILVIKVVLVRAICRFSDFSNLYMNTDGGGTLSFTIALIPVFIRAFYGRIFYQNVPSLGNLTWNAILVEIFDIGFKLVHWNRRYALNVFTPLVRKYYFLKPLLDKPSGDHFYALCLCYEKCIDILAIGYATLIQILYQYKWNENPDYATAIYSLIIQYTIETVAQIISYRLEHGYGIPVLTITKRTKFWTIYPILVATSLMIAITCTWRGVFIIHNEYWIR